MQPLLFLASGFAAIIIVGTLAAWAHDRIEAAWTHDRRSRAAHALRGRVDDGWRRARRAGRRERGGRRGGAAPTTVRTVPLGGGPQVRALRRS